MEIDKLLDNIAEETSFIVPEMLNTDYEVVKKYIEEDNRLKTYAFDLESLFRNKEHTLSEKEEKIITLASTAMGTGDDVFYNLDNSDIHLGKIKNENNELVEVTNANYNEFMNSKDRNVRIAAFKAMYGYFASLKNTFAASLKGNIKEDFFSSKVRKYNSPLEESLFADNIDISVYDKLIQTVHKHLPEMYEYMKVKKEILKLDEMHMYDIYVDLVDTETSKIPLEEGKKIIFEALKPLGEQYINDLKKAFSEKWIDIYPNIGKKSGAYSWGCYDSYPYLLMNYTDNVDSVSTMAHELGHSMHSYYSNKKQDYANHNYPIFLAEIASTTNEILLNEYCYRNALTKEEKVLYLTELLEKIRTTIYRQTMFAEFEKIMHDKEEQGISLTEEEFSNTYYELNKLYYGDNVVSDEEIRYEWARIPHFYTSFYVYKYATGLSCAIKIATDILNNKPRALENYLDFLSSGGSDYPLNILKKTGIDITTGEAIEDALKVFDQKIKELKNLYSI
jgi:oligoendopeptidase F